MSFGGFPNDPGLPAGSAVTRNSGRTFVSTQGERDFFNPVDYRTVIDADDSNGLQAAANAALAANGILLINSALSVGFSTTLQPPSGNAAVFTVLGAGQPSTQILWTGSGNASVFHSFGLKRSYIHGLRVQVPDGVNNVVGFDVDTDATRQSSGQTLWSHCSFTAGNGTGNVGWRFGHDATSTTDSSEESFHGFINCSSTYSGSGTKTGRLGFVNEHPNGVAYSFTNCSVSNSSRAFTNSSTAGAGSGQGGAFMFFDNCGGTSNDVEFEFLTTGVYKIHGGRWELGGQHLSVPLGGATTTMVINEAGVEGTGYVSATPFSLLAAVKLVQTGCQFRAAADFGATMFTLNSGVGGFGSLTLKGNSYSATAPNDQFWTINNGSWSIESTGNTYRDSTGHATKAFADRLGVWNGTVMRANRNGCYFPTATHPWVPTIGTVAVANRTYLIKFVPDDTYTATKFCFIVTTAAGSNDNVDVGVISGDMQTLIGGSGSVAGMLNVLGGRFVTGLSIPLVAGVAYYAYISMPVAFGTTAPSLATTSQVSSAIAAILGSNIGQADGMNKDGLAFPFPAPPVVTPAVLASVPVGGLLKV